MRKITVIIALVLSILSVIIATLSSYSSAFIPALLSLIFGAYAIHLSKSHIKSKKIAQLAIILASIAILVSVSKSFFIPSEAQITSPSEEKSEHPNDINENSVSKEVDNDSLSNQSE